MFGLVTVDGGELDKDLFVSIRDLCWNVSRAASATVRAGKYGVYHRDGCELLTLVLTLGWCWRSRWTAAKLPDCSKKSKLTAVCRFHLVLEKRKKNKRKKKNANNNHNQMPIF